MTPTAHYASVNGLKLYYELHGAEGHPLVLIHGGGSTIQTSFGKILPALARSHRVIAVELQAHGHTSDRNAPETFTQDADDIAELLRQLKIETADLLGFSNGGHTTIEFALRHRQRARRLIIASAFYKRSGVPAVFWEGLGQAELSHLPQLYQDEFRKINPHPAALKTMFDRDVERMQNFRGWQETDIRSIQAPTLIVSGDQDVATCEHAVEMHRLMPRSRLAIFPATHGSYLGEALSPDPDSQVPALFVALLNEFLA